MPFWVVVFLRKPAVDNAGHLTQWFVFMVNAVTLKLNTKKKVGEVQQPVGQKGDQNSLQPEMEPLDVAASSQKLQPLHAWPHKRSEDVWLSPRFKTWKKINIIESEIPSLTEGFMRLLFLPHSSRHFQMTRINRVEGQRQIQEWKEGQRKRDFPHKTDIVERSRLSAPPSLHFTGRWNKHCGVNGGSVKSVNSHAPHAVTAVSFLRGRPGGRYSFFDHLSSRESFFFILFRCTK